MAKEIERKYLVDNGIWSPGGKGLTIRQGFIPVSGHTAVRIRITGKEAYLTIKGPSNGPERSEFEYSIPLSDAETMLEELCERPLIDKIRYQVEFSGNTWEVDVFHGENEGLIIAEIELKMPDQQITLPAWVLKEVTDDPRYFNVNLTKHPYKSWKHAPS